MGGCHVSRWLDFLFHFPNHPPIFTACIAGHTNVRMILFQNSQTRIRTLQIIYNLGLLDITRPFMKTIAAHVAQSITVTTSDMTRALFYIVTHPITS